MSISNILTGMYNFLVTASPQLRPVFLVASLVLAFNAYLNSVWAGLFARVDALAASTAGTADFSPLGLINYCVPLDTILSLISAYAALRLACGGVRIIKSFVPSISG